MRNRKTEQTSIYLTLYLQLGHSVAVAAGANILPIPQPHESTLTVVSQDFPRPVPRRQFTCLFIGHSGSSLQLFTQQVYQ